MLAALRCSIYIYYARYLFSTLHSLPRATMYNHQGSQMHPSGASPWSDLRDNRLHDTNTAYGPTPGRPLPNIMGGLDADDDVFGSGPTGGRSAYGQQGPMREVSAYISHIKSAR